MPAAAPRTWEPAPTLTGLRLEDVQRFNLEDQEALYSWHRSNAGAGGTFIPWAIRRMPPESRLAQASDEVLDHAWKMRELERCRDPELGPRYFTESYGHVKPPRGRAVPFRLWPSQAEALELLRTETKVWVLKSRRLGLSWLALHYGMWVAGFNPETPGARVLVICKNLPDAGKLLDRTKDINGHLPGYLELRPGMDSRSVLELPDRDAELWALPATEGSARLETATLVILDEFAFPRNKAAARIYTAVQPTIEGEDAEGSGQLFGISTGNGRVGDGEAFAEVWDKASAGEMSTVRTLFLPWYARPSRTRKWREEQRKDYLTDEDFEAEFPETPEEALAGAGHVTVYPRSALAAAARLGEAIELTPHWLELVEEGFELGTDWGDFQTFTLYAVGLPGGGLFIVDELVQAHTEPGAASENILRHEPGGMAKVRFIASRADAAPAGTNATYAATLDRFRREHPGRYPETHVKVPFGVYKEGGGDRKGINTIGYVRRLLEATERLMDGDGWDGSPGDLHGCLAIHPRCSTLLAQARNLERDPETAKVKKPKLDPKKLEKGDHGPDAAVALAASRAAEFVGAGSGGEDGEE